MQHSSMLIGALGLALACSSSLAATSTFSYGAEGWVAQGDIDGPLTWTPTGGHPDGHVTIDDATTGGVTYFVAPSNFLGNMTGAIGQNLAFDLQQVYPGAPNQFDDADVILQGGGLTLAHDTLINPANGAWTTYSVPLLATGWRLNDLSGGPVSDAQFLAVMSNLTSLRIRAEYQSGPDIGKLDNVALVPEPTTYAMLLGGLAILAGAVRRRGKVTT